MATGVLYVLACAAPRARDLPDLVTLAQTRGWDVCVIATPQATKFLNLGQLYLLTGHPIRTEYKHPDEPDVLPQPDALIVAPATFNTINKWAAGISDTLALGLLNEAIGKRLPILALPAVNPPLALHPAFDRSLNLLREWGVTVLEGPDIWQRARAAAPDQQPSSSPWQLALDTLERMKRPR
jgi:phosphopantothenoylcysteine synthetase/decarboxylase